MKNLKKFYYPKTLKETLEILAQNDKSDMLNLPVAGSTGIVFSKKPTIKGLIDINRIGLDYIKVENEQVKIGAAVTVQKISRSEIIKSLPGGLLALAAGSIGSRLIRNSCTIGGNIVDLRIWSDMPVPLLVLDGKIKVESKSGERIISAEEFFKRKPSKLLKSNELVTEIIIPISPKNATGSFIKFARTKVDYTIMDVAAYFELTNKSLKNMRIAVSGITLFPCRLKSIEEFIEGKTFNKELLEKIGNKVSEEIKPLKTYKVSEEYRKHLSQVLIKRVIEESYTRAGKEVLGK